jgi:outer membrane protein assembly factor BamB
MTDSSSQLPCPKCGATLQIAGNTPTIHCPYCNDTVENPYYHPPQAKPARSKSSSVRPGGSGRVIRWILILLLAGLVVCVGVVVAVAPGLMSSLSSVTLVPLQIQTQGLWLPSDGAPNVIVVTWDVTKDQYALSLLDMGTHKALWSALAQKDYLRIDELATGDNLVYVTIGARLLALQMSDGKQVWDASLPDQIAGNCERCLLFENGQVVALTTDDSLDAYDAQTGRRTWGTQFEHTGYSLYSVDGAVGVTYEMKKDAGFVTAFGVFDAASGKEQTHIEPACSSNKNMPPDMMGTSAEVIIDTSGKPARAYFFFGSFGACIQRWDLSSGKLEWEHVDADQSLSYYDGRVLFANGAFYFIQRDQQMDQLRSLDAATGKQMQILDKNEAQDYSLFPLLVSGQRLVVRAKRTHGSTRFELWGYDLGTGKNLWKRPILNSEPLDPPDAMAGLLDKNSPGWTYFQTSTGLWLLTFQAQPNQVNLAQVNLDTGELSGQKALSFEVTSSSDFYDLPVRLNSRDHLAWFLLLDRIYVVNPATGAFAYRWP